MRSTLGSHMPPTTDVLNRFKNGALLILVLALPYPAGADGEVAPEILGDVEYGKFLSSECVTCHNVSVAGNNIPSLNGWTPDHLVQIMNAYRAKKLDNPTMQMVAARLTDEQIASLALYFATLEAPDAD